MMLVFYNVGMRGFSMAAKFALTLYLARYFTLEDLGKFGLVSGVVGAAPAIVGLGLNYFMTRTVVGKTLEEAGSLIRGRLLITCCVSVPFAIVCAYFCWRLTENFHLSFAICWLIIFECLSLDIFQALIGVDRPIYANFLLFLRSSVWIAPFIVVAFLFKSFEKIEFLVYCWCISSLVALLVPVVLFKLTTASAQSPVLSRWSWLPASGTTWFMVYLSDVAIVWQLYADRFIINHFLGESAVGRYTLATSLVGAVAMLVIAAFIQPSTSILVGAHRNDPASWRKLIVRKLFRILVAYFFVSFFFAALIFFILPHYFSLDRYLVDWHLLVLIWFVFLFKVLGDFLALGLYSAANDRPVYFWNILGMLIGSIVTVTIAYFGNLLLVSVGLASVAFLMVLGRVYSLYVITVRSRNV